MNDELVVGRYQRVRTLGAGGMGEVWLADDLELGRQVAVKKLLVGLGSGSDPALDAGMVERMVREARVVARLKHHHIVTLHDLVRVDGRPYLIMEYVEGESLGDRIQREGTLSWTAVGPLIAEVASALAEAHRMGVLHRDVKPANILIDTAGHAHLADFGIARGTEDAAITVAGELVGTVSYMAPEVARTNEAGAPSDVWSLGATLFAAVEGCAPFAGTGGSVPQIIARLINDDAPSPRHAGGLAPLVDRMLATDPAARPTAADVAAEIPALLAQVHVDAPVTEMVDVVDPDATHRSPTPSHGTSIEQEAATEARSITPRRRRRRWTLAAAAVLIVTGVGVVAAMLGGGTDDDPGGAAAHANSSATSIEVGGIPGRLALSADGTVALVPDTGGTTVAVIDTATGGFETVDVGAAPSSVTLSEDGDLAYASLANESLAVVDVSSLEVVKEIEVDGVPGTLTLTRDGGTAYVVTDAGVLEVIDTASSDVKDVPVESERRALTLTPDESKGYLPNELTGSVSVLDTATADVTASIPVGVEPTAVAISPDGARAYVATRDGIVSVIRTSDDSVLRTVTVGGHPGRVTLTSDGNLALCPDPMGRRFHIIHTKTSKVTTIDGAGRLGTGIQLPAGTTTGYAPDYESGEVAAIDLATGEVELLAAGPDPQYVTVSADASRLYVVNFAEDDDARGTVTVVDLTG